MTLVFLLFALSGVLHVVSAADRKTAVPWASLAWAAFSFAFAAGASGGVR